jgi:hypothetical protein
MTWFSLKSKVISQLRQLYAWLRNDMWRKVLALLLGIACWFYIDKMHVRYKSQQWDSIEDVKINLRGSPKIFIPEQSLPKVRLKISVNFSARSQRFTAGDFRLEIDPSKLPSPDSSSWRPSLQQPSRVVLSNQEHVLRKPAGVSILGFDPPDVEIYYDTRDILQKNVHVPIQGGLKKGYRQKLTVNPVTISVSGPLSMINPLMVIETEPLLLNEKKLNDFSTTLKVFNPDSRVLEVYPKTVEVRVSIEDTQSYSRQKFAPVPLGILIRPDSGLQISSKLPSSVEAILHGQISSLEAIDRNLLKAILDLTSFNQPGIYHVPVQMIGMPGDLKAEYINPSTFSLTLSLLPQPAEQTTPLGDLQNEEAQ